MMPIVTLLSLVLLYLASGTTARVCRGAGYDLSSLTYSDVALTTGGYTWYFRPCSNVTFSGCVSREQTFGGAMMCQTQGTNAWSIATWSPLAEQTSSWLPLANGGGVQLRVSDGEQCGSLGARGLIVNFLCDRTATSQANFLNITEGPTCTYTAIIGTAAACPPIVQPGQGCSAFGYDFTPISNADLVYKSTASNYTFYYRPCGVVTSAQCANNPNGQQVSGNAMVCQAAGTNNEMGSTWELAAWNPNQIQYEKISNGVSMFVQNGASESGCQFGMGRAVTIKYVCNPQVLASFTGFTELVACDYVGVVETSIVCPPSTVYQEPVKCGGEYDLALLSVVDISINTGGWTYVFRPCGSVTNLACQNDAGTASGSMVCQLSADQTYSYSIASYDETVTAWNPIQGGVSMTVTDGAFCAAINANRSFTANFRCAPGLQGAKSVMTSFQELSTCNYVAEVQTSLVCAASTNGYCGPPGTNFDFSVIGGDLTYVTPGGAYAYYFQPCGSVSNQQCQLNSATNGSMMCQAVLGNAAAYDIGFFDANLARWFPISNGWQMQIQDGQSCSNLRFPRLLNVNFICDPNAKFPIFNNLTEGSICDYTAYVTTKQACAPVAAGASTGAMVPVNTDPYGQWSFENPTHCGGPYDLTSLATYDMTYETGPYRFALRVCGSVKETNCTRNQATATSMFCQAVLNDASATTYPLAQYNPFIVQYRPIQYGGRPGLIMTLQDGGYCGQFQRITNVYFMCDPAATTAVMTNVTENPQCTYNAVVRTSLVCFNPPATCGGAGYDLSFLTQSAGDLTTTSGGYNWYLKPCGVVSNPQCNANNTDTAGIAMVCQAVPPPSTTTYLISMYEPDDAVWAPLPNNGGVSMTIQTGTTCGSNDFERLLVINFRCGISNTGRANLTSIAEQSTCYYVANVDTGRSCNDIKMTSSSSSKLSDGAIAGAVVGSVVGAAILIAVLVVICCGCCARSGKASSTKYNDEGQAKASGRYGEMEPSAAEMSEIQHDETA